MYEDICANFQKTITQIGESCAGDEKLFHFTGQSRDIRLVPSKPGRVGLWNYQLCVPMQHGGQYLLHTRLSVGGEGLAVSEVVRKWSSIIKSYDFKGTLLTMDSYYMDNTSQRLLSEENIKYVASFASDRFKTFKNVMEAKVNVPGDWYGLHHPGKKESVIFHWSNDHRVGKKWVMSNACRKVVSNANTTSVPIYDLYKVTFNVCDKFNFCLKGKTWPHRKGGNSRYGDKGAQHDYMFSCILINTVNVWLDLQGEDHENADFQDAYIQLADQLFLSLFPTH
jgi:hypothetical protein